MSRRAARRRCGLAAVAAAALAIAAAPAGPRVTDLGGIPAEVAILLLEEGGGGTLHLAALALAESAAPVDGAGAGSRFRLPVVFELPASAGAAAAGIDLYLYALDAGGGVAGHLARRIELPAAAADVKLLDAVDLAPGRYELRFLAYQPGTRRWARVRRSAEVGAAPPAGPGPPRLAEACPRAWSLARGPGVEGEPPAWTARPVLRSGRGALMRSLWRGAGELPAASPVGLALAPRGGGDRLLLPARIGAAAPADGGRWIQIEVERFEAPQGIYDLQLELAGRPAPPVEVWVLDAAAVVGRAGTPEPARRGPGCEPGWAEVARRAEIGGVGAAAAGSLTGPAAAGAEPDAGDAGDDSRRRAIAAAYRRILGGLAATGEPASSALELEAMEAAAVADDPRRLAGLRAAERQVAESLAAVDPESLIPVLRLHEIAYGGHYAAGRYALAGHSRELSLSVATLLAERAPESAAARVAGDLLTGVALAASRGRMELAAQALLERAVELDPGQESARLLLAAGHERLGAYDAARRQLEELIELNAAATEARLRLASLLERDGRLRESERLLRALVSERPRPWVLSLAYQTLGRVLARRERFGEAAELLREATVALPDDQRLRLFYAYLLDRAGRASEGAAALAELPAAAGRSSRWRYAEVETAARETGELGALEERLERHVAVRLPRLGLALAALDGAGD